MGYRTNVETTLQPNVEFETVQPNVEKNCLDRRSVLTWNVHLGLTWKTPVGPNVEYTIRPDVENTFEPNVEKNSSAQRGNSHSA